MSLGVLLVADDAHAVIETVIPVAADAATGGAIISPYSFLFTGEDRLRVTVWSSVGVVRGALHYRMHQLSGAAIASRQTFLSTQLRVGTTTEFDIGEGYLLSAVVFAEAGNPVIGQAFVKVEIIRGSGAAATLLGVIMQDYITASQGIAWPGSPIRNSWDGKGVTVASTGAFPGAGAVISQSVPLGARWELMSLFCLLTTDATVITRCAQLTYLTGGISKGLVADAATQVASTGIFYQWELGVTPYAQALGATHHLPLVPDLHLFAGETFQVSAANLQAGDVFSTVRFTVREWLEAL